MLGWFREEMARASRSKRALSGSQIDLDSDDSSQPRIASPIHFAHAAEAHYALDFVWSQVENRSPAASAAEARI